MKTNGSAPPKRLKSTPLVPNYLREAVDVLKSLAGDWKNKTPKKIEIKNLLESLLLRVDLELMTFKIAIMRIPKEYTHCR